MPGFFSKDKRKYPVKRDQLGRSIRQLCFHAFDEGRRPSEIAKNEGFCFKTVCTYFYQWKKLPPKSQERYEVMKLLLKRNPKYYQEIVDDLSETTGKHPREIKAHLQTPWGLKQLISGKWAKIHQEEEEKRRKHGKHIIYKLLEALIEDSGVTQKDIIGKLYELVEERNGNR